MSIENKDISIIKTEEYYDLAPGFLFSFSAGGEITNMNAAFLERLGRTKTQTVGIHIEQLLTVGSRIFFQTHLLPLINIQRFASEIYLAFQGLTSEIPVLFNARITESGNSRTIHCGGMEISNRNRFEKELLHGKKNAETALFENAELLKVQAELKVKEHLLEKQFRDLESLSHKQRQIFKVISHDLQEPLRKSVMFADLLIQQNPDFPKPVSEKLRRVISFNERMRHILTTLQRYEELENRELKLEPGELGEIIAKSLSVENIDRDILELETDISCPKILVDNYTVVNMFSELFLASVKFRDLSKKLQISIEAMVVKKDALPSSSHQYSYEDFVRIVYRDNGLGFFNLSSGIFEIVQPSEKIDNVGLGMAFCKKIVEKHGGNMDAKFSNTQGIDITILLPFRQESLA